MVRSDIDRYLIVPMTSCTIYYFQIIAIFGTIAASALTIDTQYGKVRGISERSATGKNVNAWYGIPYAEKPLGALRFRPSRPPQPWEDILDASKSPRACLQTWKSYSPLQAYFPGKKLWIPKEPMSEDCLYLTVVAPNPAPTNATVMVWIHGGGFYSGTNALTFYDHKILATEENVVVVSMQYRLGVFGFLSLEKELTGNAGLFDQFLALQWIKDNIVAFGGDPASITIFGESAGAGSVSHHLLSPLSTKLFSRAIMQSGVALSPWATVPLSVNLANSLYVAKQLGCSSDLELMINCLQEADADTVIAAQDTIPRQGLVSIPFYPVVDGTFIVRDPIVTLNEGLYHPKNILLGINEHEGNFFLLYYESRFNSENLTITRSMFLEEVPKIIIGNVLETEAIIYEYTDWSQPNDEKNNLEALEKILGDAFFTCSVYDFALIFSERSEVFFYQYKHQNPLHQWPLWAGAMHGDEIVFVFGEPLDPAKNYTSEQANFSRQIMRYWANFARTGNPNCVSVESCETAWPTFKPSGPNYINLDVGDFTVSTEPIRPRKCAFWKHFVPKIKKLSGDLK